MTPSVLRTSPPRGRVLRTKRGCNLECLIPATKFLEGTPQASNAQQERRRP